MSETRSRRTEAIQRSAMAFMRGACYAVSTAWVPIEAKTASKVAVNLASRAGVPWILGGAMAGLLASHLLSGRFRGLEVALGKSSRLGTHSAIVPVHCRRIPNEELIWTAIQGKRRIQSPVPSCLSGSPTSPSNSTNRST